MFLLTAERNYIHSDEFPKTDPTPVKARRYAWASLSLWWIATLTGRLMAYVGDSHLAIYLRDTPWVWPLCETIHFIGLAMVVGIAGFFDLRLLGFFNRVPISVRNSCLGRWSVSP
jgi:hypothetical protein